MRKLLFIFAALVIAFPLWAQEDPANEEFTVEETVLETDFFGEETDWEDDPFLAEEEPDPRLQNRGFEIGIIYLKINAENNFLALDEIFTETIIVDLENFDKGFRLGFGTDIRPLFFNVNKGNRWGFGMDIGRVTAYGNVDISGNLLRFKRTDKDNFGIGAAAFAEIGIPGFFHIPDFTIKDYEVKDLKIKVRLSGFMTMAYMMPDMHYTYKDSDNGSLLEIDYGMKLYTPFSLAENDDIFKTLGGSGLGFDFGLGAEYPLFSFLDLGVDIINIPLVPSKPEYYMEMKGRVFVDSSKINLSDVLDGKKLPKDVFESPEDFDPVYGKSSQSLFRPFKMVFHADYRPLETRLLSLIPTLGFSVNPLYATPGALEAGIKVRCDINNLFIATLGLINYEDRLWKNGIDLTLNLRAVQLDLGIAMQSQTFVKSWEAGLGITFGVTYGW
jgi:hypothetical protein